MGKAIIALLVTFLAGWIGMTIGFELLGGFPEFGSVVAVSVMGAFIIYFSEKRNELQEEDYESETDYHHLYGTDARTRLLCLFTGD